LLSPKQIGTICFIFSILIFPTYATINVQPGSTANCNSATLTTSENDVTANLTAQYHANTITFTYDANGGTTSNGGTWSNNAATQCTYDTNFNLPTAPSKTGYNFDGWKVKATPVCNLSESQIDALTQSDYGLMSFFLSGYDPTRNVQKYGLTERNTWAVEFTNGAIARGEASCNNDDSKETAFDYDDEYVEQFLQDPSLCGSDAMQSLTTAIENGEMTMEEAQAIYDERGCDAMWDAADAAAAASKQCDVMKPANAFNKTSTGQYCWCRMTSYTPSGGSTCDVTTKTPWVSTWNSGFDVSSCSNLCVERCAEYVADASYAPDGFRQIIFSRQTACNYSGSGNSGGIN